MRVRFGILVLALAAALSGCGGDDKSKASDTGSPGSSETRLSTPSDPMTEVTIPCAKFEDAARKISAAMSSLYSQSGAAGAVTQLASELGALKDGAPDNVDKAIDELVAAFGKASDLMKHPNDSAAQAELAGLATKLSEAGRTVSDYVVSKCTG